MVLEKITLPRPATDSLFLVRDVLLFYERCQCRDGLLVTGFLPRILAQRDFCLELLCTTTCFIQVNVGGAAEFLMARLPVGILVTQVVGALSRARGADFHVQARAADVDVFSATFSFRAHKVVGNEILCKFYDHGVTLLRVDQIKLV
jgi:hypothetical protein